MLTRLRSITQNIYFFPSISGVILRLMVQITPFFCKRYFNLRNLWLKGRLNGGQSNRASIMAVLVTRCLVARQPRSPRPIERDIFMTKGRSRLAQRLSCSLPRARSKFLNSLRENWTTVWNQTFKQFLQGEGHTPLSDFQLIFA